MDALPPFNDAGDFPLGIHEATLTAALERLGHGSLQREVVARRLRRILKLARDTEHLARFIVFGSFVTANLAPNDLDVFLVMDDTFDAEQLGGEQAILFSHALAQAYFGASVFWIRQLAALGGEHAMIEQWQIKRDGGHRGIVEVVDQ